MQKILYALLFAALIGGTTFAQNASHNVEIMVVSVFDGLGKIIITSSDGSNTQQEINAISGFSGTAKFVQNRAAVVKLLNELSSQGWQIIGISNTYDSISEYVLQRPRQR